MEINTDTVQPLCVPCKAYSYVLTGRYKFKHKKLYDIIIPFKFEFDGASIPRVFWGILGLTPHGVMDGPAVLHDYLYSCHRKGTGVQVSRGLADEVFYELCLYFGINKLKSWLMYKALRAFGWKAWRK